MKTLRGLAAAILSAGLLGLTIGLALPLVSVALERQGVGETLIGVSAAAQFLGIMAGAPLAPRLIPRFGLLPVMTAALAAAAGALALMPALAAYGPWLALRFVLGAAEGLIFVATETWINQAVGDAVRGRVMSIYTTALAGGMALGPQLIRVTGVEGAAPFLVGAGALLTGMAILLAFAPGTAPRIGGALSFGFAGYLAALPVAAGATALFGFADGGLIAMLPVYGLGVGFDDATAASLVTALACGGIALMFPIGWLVDRADRRRIVIACAAAAAVAVAAIPLLAASAPALYALLFAVGGLLGGLWLVAMALLGERFRGTDLAAANVGLTFAYGIGSIAGPAVAGAALEAWPPHGMMLAIAACIAAFAVYGAAASRRARAHAACPPRGRRYSGRRPIRRGRSA